MLALAGCLAVAGCVTVRLIADYDEQIDRGITAFHRATANHLAALEGAIGTADAAYAKHAEFYRQARVDLSSLRVRAAARDRNEITVQQMDLLAEQVATLERMHKEGLQINDIRPLRDHFNAGVTAILKLELAKRRGAQ